MNVANLRILFDTGLISTISNPDYSWLTEYDLTSMKPSKDYTDGCRINTMLKYATFGENHANEVKMESSYCAAHGEHNSASFLAISETLMQWDKICLSPPQHSTNFDTNIIAQLDL